MNADQENPKLSEFATSDFRAILKSEFERRQRRNPVYSLRAYARDLGLKAYNLSDVLNERCGLSRASALRISKVLGHTPEESRIFGDLVESHHARSRSARESAKKRLAQTHQKYARPLNEDLIRLFTDWKVLAVLQAIVILDGSMDAAAIASRLKIETREATHALELLQAYGLIRVTDGKAAKTDDFIRLESEVPSSRIRDFHKQIASLTVSLIDQQPVSARKNVATVMTFDSRRTEEARQFIAEMHDQFLKRFATDENVDSVYVLSNNFLKLDS